MNQLINVWIVVIEEKVIEERWGGTWLGLGLAGYSPLGVTCGAPVYQWVALGHVGRR